MGGAVRAVKVMEHMLCKIGEFLLGMAVSGLVDTLLGG